VVLQINIEAKAGDTPFFVSELTYAGVFALANIPEDTLQPLLLIECPRILFPFARRIVADVTRDGGLPPLLLDPIDFATLYRRRLAQRAAQPDGATANA
jgi:preprotein translocase subunit SecB